MENTEDQASSWFKKIRSPKILTISLASLTILIVLAVSGYYFFWPKANLGLLQKEGITPTVTALQPPAPLSFQTFTLTTTEINDPGTEFYFSDANKIYKVRLDGSTPQEITSLPRDISISLLPNEDLLISMEVGRFVKNENKGPGEADYKQILEEGEEENRFWLLKSNSASPVKITSERWSTLSQFKNAPRFERIYTQELPSGQADILLDNLNGSEPIKIGALKEKLVTPGCESASCPSKKYPEEFSPSFDRSYLLNNPGGGGGLGESAIVVSGNGTKVYDIGFYWFVSSAIWLDSNVLLTKAQDGKQKIFTFNEDGVFNAEELREELGGNFNQNGLSPSRKLLAIENIDPAGISLFDFDKRQILTIEKENREKLIEQYGLQDEILIDPRINHSFTFLGWNRKGDKFLYAETIAPFADTNTGERLEIREIKIYDVTTGKIHTIAKLNPHPKNPEEYLLKGKPVANILQFAIK
jgi:hypothetical protein